jgi:hypothetical protein
MFRSLCRKKDFLPFIYKNIPFRCIGTNRSSDISTIDVNQTTFAIKSPLTRVFKEPNYQFGWEPDMSDIHMRFQCLRPVELDLLYKKLEQEGKIDDHIEEKNPQTYFQLLQDVELMNLWSRGKLNLLLI